MENDLHYESGDVKIFYTFKNSQEDFVIRKVMPPLLALLLNEEEKK